MNYEIDTSVRFPTWTLILFPFNLLNAELYPIFHLLALLGVHYIFHVIGLRVNSLAATFSTTYLNRQSNQMEIPVTCGEEGE